MTDAALDHVVIVGGGTAGWLTAGLLAADHRAQAADGLRVTLVESPTTPILGVGEGTWPSLRDTLRRIGLSETAFIRRCDASFKQGSRFDGWRDGGPDDTYFHPFDAPPSQDDVDLSSLWRAASPGSSFASAVGSQAALCLAGCAPKQPQTPEYAAVANYAYHLDAVAFADLLKTHCTGVLGVRHVLADVIDVEIDETGAVAAVKTSQHGDIAGDLFVDCTGQRALIVGEHLKSGLTDVGHHLFNDRALAVQAAYGAPDAPVAAQTTATATPAGWIWDIGLGQRRGIGHVYSSGHQDEAAARAELARYLQRTAPGCAAKAEDARLIQFRSAYRKEPWVQNAVAIGMAQGFVEPLEASAIVMIELSATMLSDTLPPRKSGLALAARRFNDRFAYRWARIVDFLKLHYILSRRPEPYWADHRNPQTWPDRLRELLPAWRHQPPSREDFVQTQEIFPAASYAYVLYGMGFETDAPTRLRRQEAPERVRRRAAEIAERTRTLLAGLPSTRALLDHVHGRGLRQG